MGSGIQQILSVSRSLFDSFFLPACDRLVETLLVKGLQQVVDRVCFAKRDRVNSSKAVVKITAGGSSISSSISAVLSSASGYQENKIRLMLLHGLYTFKAVVALLYHGQFGKAVQVFLDDHPRQRSSSMITTLFIVYGDSDHHNKFTFGLPHFHQIIAAENQVQAALHGLEPETGSWAASAYRVKGIDNSHCEVLVRKYSRREMVTSPGNP